MRAARTAEHPTAAANFWFELLHQGELSEVILARLPGRTGKPLTQSRLARLLKPLAITPQNVGPEKSRVRGYRREQFEDAFERYLTRRASTNSAELVGKTGIYLGDDGVRTFASYLIRLRPSLLSTNPRFLNMTMNTPEFRETQIIPLIKKQTGQANVNGTALKNMLIPLPPLAEQHRVVAKVDALMGLCNRLEASLATAADTRRRLLDALLADALAPSMEHKFEAAE